MSRKLFCELSPFTYRLSIEKGILKRHLKDFFGNIRFARERTETALPVPIYQHKSLIRRRLGNVDMQLQENKATNLALAVTRINGLLIRPGETFSVWKLVGRTTKRKGFKEGLTIAKGQPSKGIGGGLCQLSNLIHWMVLHSELTIVEHHHHDGLCGELRAAEQQPHTFHIHVENEYFSRERQQAPAGASGQAQAGDGTSEMDYAVYRNGQVYRDVIDRVTGSVLESQLIRTNHAKVMYECPPSITIRVQ